MGKNDFILIENIIKAFADRLFDGYEIRQAACYRVTRDMDLDVSESDTSDFLLAVKKQLEDREHGHVTRLEVETSMNVKLLKHLMKRLKVEEASVFTINGPIDLTFLKKLPGMVEGHDDLRYKAMTPFVDPALRSDHNILTPSEKKTT